MKHTPALMFQGTCSNAGKSVLTAALGRILLQDGLSVAPFKSQNMSLNSFVTRDGLEMGRAQVVQAQACRLDPDVRMNPILLKPSSDTGCQVIVNGRAVGNMKVNDYIKFKKKAFEEAKKAYDSLAAEYEVIILEGAGSPAEVNLKQHDIVNMAMARYAGAGVLIVGDIDRGGVFASFLGTIEILDQWERDLVAGFVINRFRGRKSLLADGLDYIQRKTGKPVLGVIDYLPDLGLPEEDSVSFKEGLFTSSQKNGAIELALIDLPHISNFTDFEPFLAEPDVRLNVVRQAADLKNPNAVLLPGSKNVIADLEFLQASGLAKRIIELSGKAKTEIVGICGGFQMLGRTINDPCRVESDRNNIKGLGLLNLQTVMAAEKTLTRRKGIHLESGCPVLGYEIHHGKTGGDSVKPLLRINGNELSGACSGNKMIWGTYLHGIFDQDEFRRWFIDRLRRLDGREPLEKVQAVYDLEPAFDRLAARVREQIDMSALYQMLGACPPP